MLKQKVMSEAFTEGRVLSSEEASRRVPIVSNLWVLPVKTQFLLVVYTSVEMLNLFALSQMDSLSLGGRRICSQPEQRAEAIMSALGEVE